MNICRRAAQVLVLLASAVAVCVLARTNTSTLIDTFARIDPAPVLDFQRDSLLSRILIPRVPDSANSTRVREAIIAQLQSTGNKWHIETPSFTARTPFGPKNMTNIVATRDPTAARRLVLAAHYDSKYYAPKKNEPDFVGATDSAVPCALLVDTALALDGLLDRYTEQRKNARATSAALMDDVSLQLIFFDGEEAFLSWTSTDSVYGSRHLAQTWSRTWLTHAFHGGPLPARAIDAIDQFVLLDLLGAPDMHIPAYFESTRWVYNMMKRAEDDLRASGRLVPAGRQAPRQIFSGEVSTASISDDHEPFLIHGVPIVHVIPYPFPTVWHTKQDDASALDYDVIYACAQIMRVFTAEYLGL